jgi:hypothetical protein
MRINLHQSLADQRREQAFLQLPATKMMQSAIVRYVEHYVADIP